jgi:tetrahydrodipicolinate N-succinyltransferase
MASVAKCTPTPGQTRKAVLKLQTVSSVRDVFRGHGVSLRTVYRWRANVVLKQQRTEDVERLRSLEAKHRRLQRQYAELALDYVTLRVALMKDVKGDC